MHRFEGEKQVSGGTLDVASPACHGFKNDADNRARKCHWEECWIWQAITFSLSRVDTGPGQPEPARPGP
uniref:Uncharacterized protein n=1 Tax=Panagrellus redivivus TaxID=6233 RepID=A0A7E4V7Y8_PANRE